MNNLEYNGDIFSVNKTKFSPYSYLFQNWGNVSQSIMKSDYTDIIHYSGVHVDAIITARVTFVIIRPSIA